MIIFHIRRPTDFGDDRFCVECGYRVNTLIKGVFNAFMPNESSRDVEISLGSNRFKCSDEIAILTWVHEM